MDAVKRKLHGVRVLLHGIASLLRTARATIDAVGKSYPAVEETSHAVEESSHGFLRARGAEAGEMLASRVRFLGRERGLGGGLRAINMLLSMFNAIFRSFSCKSRIFFSHLQSAAKKVEKFFRGVNRLF